MSVNVTETNVAICRAIGLDPTRIQKDGVRITLTGDLGPVVEVTYNCFKDDKIWAVNGEVVTELKRYQLVPIEIDDAAQTEDVA